MFNNGFFDNGFCENGAFGGPFGQSYSTTALRSSRFTASFAAASTATWDSGALGYTPRLVRVRSVFRSGTTAGPAPCFSEGWASAAAERLSTAQYLESGLVAPVSTMTRSALYNDAVLSQIDTTRTGALDPVFGAESVQLTVLDAFAAAVDVEVTVFGGPAFEGAKVGTVNLASGTSLQSFVDPDFEPTLLMMIGPASGTQIINTINTGIDLTQGWATGPTARQCLVARHQNNQATPGVWTMATTGRFFSGISASAGTELRGVELVSFDDPGYTVQGNPNASASVYGFIAVRGPQVQLFTALSQTGVGAFNALTGLSFEARRVDFMGNPNVAATQSAGARPIEVVFGTADNTGDNSALWWGCYDYSPLGAGSPTDPLGQRSDTKCYLNHVRSGVGATTLQGDAKVTALSTSVVMDQTDADPTAGFLLGLVWGDRLVTYDAGAFVLTGQDATLTKGRVLGADVGAFTLAGQTAAFAVARGFAADGGAYPLTGQDATLRPTRELTADVGAFTISGQVADLHAVRLLAADVGAYILGGQDAALFAPSAFVLVADGGAFALAGKDATLTATTRVLSADVGAHALTGQSATLTLGRVVTAAAGAFTLGGQAAGLSVTARRLTAEVGGLVLAGQDAALTYVPSLGSLAQLDVELYPLGRWIITDHTTTRYSISEGTMATTETTASAYLWLTEDQEPDAGITRRNAATGVEEPATGLANISFSISATKGGAAIGALTWAASERGTTGHYVAVADTATLVAGLPEATYPDYTPVFLVLNKTGDIAARSWRKLIRRQRTGDG